MQVLPTIAVLKTQQFHLQDMGFSTVESAQHELQEVVVPGLLGVPEDVQELCLSRGLQ